MVLPTVSVVSAQEVDLLGESMLLDNITPTDIIPDIVEPEVIPSEVVPEVIQPSNVVVQTEELSKELVDAVKLTDEALDLYEIDLIPLADSTVLLPEELDGSKIEVSRIEWLTPDDVENNDPKLLNLVWMGNGVQSIRARINFALSGQHSYNEGDVKITIPKYIFKDRDGNNTGRVTLGVPMAPDKTGTFAYAETPDSIIITNTKKLSSATSGMVELTITDLTPSTIKDLSTGYQTDALKADIEVTTHLGNAIGKSTDELKVQVDTNANITSAVKRGSVVRESWYPNWPSELKPSNHEDYVYVEWTVYNTLSANQPFSVVMEDVTKPLASGEQGIVLGYQDNRTRKVYSGDGTGSIVVDVFDGFTTQSPTMYGVVYTAYPKSSFPVGDVYNIENTVNYTLTSKDDHEVTTANATAQLNYTPVTFSKPEGHFDVDKEGWGDILRRVGGKHEGIYSFELSRLKDGNSVDLDYRIITSGFGMPWTVADSQGDEVVDETNINNYGKVPYKMVVEDTHTAVTGIEGNLTLDDFEFKSLRFNNASVYTYGRHSGNDVYTYFEKDGVVTHGLVIDGQYAYLKTDIGEFPVLEVYATINGQENIKVADVKMLDNNGNVSITTYNGASVSGQQLVFPRGVTYYRVDTNTTKAAVLWDMVPTVTLKPSASVLKRVEELYSYSDTPRDYLHNYVALDLELKGNYVDDLVIDVGRNELQGFAYGSRLTKSLNYKNDKSNRNIKLTYRATSTTHTNINDKKILDELEVLGMYEPTTEGIWYDLLPVGVIPDTRSIRVNDGSTVSGIRVVENYKGSGRMLLEVRTKIEPDYKYTSIGSSMLGSAGLGTNHWIEFDANYSWVNYGELGGSLTNNIAFESVGVKVGNVDGFKGEPDTPLAGNNFTSKGSVVGVEDIFTDLNPNHNNESFTYAITEDKIIVDTYANTSIRKLVDVNDEGLYGDGLINELGKNVYEGGSYSYEINIKNPSTNSSKDIIIWDSLENFVPLNSSDDKGDVQWRGTFNSIDVSSLEAMGVEPIIYYSTVPNLKLDDEDDRSHNDLSRTDLWTTEVPKDKSTITGIAIDARMGKDGNPFILGDLGSITAYIKMTAPMVSDLANAGEESMWYDTQLSNAEVESGLVGGAHAYNNVVMTGTTISKETGVESANLLVRHDYTKVGLKPYTVRVKKVWDDGDDRDGKRTESAVIRLVENGKVSDKFQVVNDDTNWEAEFTNLPYQDADGNRVLYSITEDHIDGYNLIIRGGAEKDGVINYTAINQHIPERIAFVGTKRWENDTPTTRSESINVNLLANGVLNQSKTVRPNNQGEWKIEFPNLYKYEDKQEIKYTIEEATYVPGYVSRVEGNNIVNEYDPFGDLTISKEVINNTDVVDTKDFKFNIEFKGENGEVDVTTYTAERKTYNGDDVVNTETLQLSTGTVFTLNQYQTVTVHDVPSEVTYTVTEEDEDGFTLMTGPNTLRGVIRAGKESKVEVVNKYDAVGVGYFNATKNVENRKVDAGIFVFDVLDESGKVLRSGVNNKEGKVNLGAIRYTQADVGKTFTYTIKERIGDRTYFEYDPREYKVVVAIADNGDGTLNVDQKLFLVGQNGDEAVDSVVFNNIYRAEGSVNLRAWKQIKGGFDVPDKEFTFEVRTKEIYTGDGDTKQSIPVDNPDDVKAVGSADSNGVIDFTGINYNESDIGKTFIYVATEVKGDDETVIYDESSVEFKVQVVDNGDGTLSFNASAIDLKTDDINNKEDTPLFVNEYKPGSLTVQKQILGGDPNKEFTFRVKLTGDESLIPKGTFNMVRSTFETVSGDATFKYINPATGNFEDIYRISKDDLTNRFMGNYDVTISYEGDLESLDDSYIGWAVYAKNKEDKDYKRVIMEGNDRVSFVGKSIPGSDIDLGLGNTPTINIGNMGATYLLGYAGLVENNNIQISNTNHVIQTPYYRGVSVDVDGTTNAFEGVDVLFVPLKKDVGLNEYIYPNVKHPREYITHIQLASNNYPIN